MAAADDDDVTAESDSEADARERRERRALLDELTREAEEMGLYDDPPPDYRTALKKTRKRRSQETSPSTELPD